MTDPRIFQRSGRLLFSHEAREEFYEEIDDSPYCECGCEPIEDELACNKCCACGKPLS
jgi:hypothetical protein